MTADEDGSMEKIYPRMRFGGIARTGPIPLQVTLRVRQSIRGDSTVDA